MRFEGFYDEVGQFMVYSAGVGVLLGFVLGLSCGQADGKVTAQHHACGECDHVGECGDYECRPGVDGWQLKAGAR